MSRASSHNKSGILIVEAILSIALFAIFAAGAVYLLTASILTSRTAQRHATAAAYATEAIEAVQSIDRLAWNELTDSPDSTYGLQEVGDDWTLVADPDHPHGDTDFTRTITISDAYRDSSDQLTDTATGNTFDPHTRKITVQIDWITDTGSSQQMTSATYLSDWDAEALSDDAVADWTAGTLDHLRVSNIDDGELQIIQPTLEVGSVTVSNSWQTVTLSNEYDEAVVITSILDGNNPNSPVSTRVRNVTATSFDVRLQFPTDNFGPSTTNSETVYYLVVEAGVWTLGDGSTKLEAGVVPAVSQVNCSACGTWNQGTDVYFQHAYSSAPVLLHQVVTENDSNWITTFASDDTAAGLPPGTDGFQVALNGAEVTTTHSAEDIAYVALQSETTDEFEGVKFETDLTGNTVRGFTDPHRTENFDQSYAAAPLVLTSMLSARTTDGNWAMIDAISSTQVTLYADEDQTSNAERSHTTDYAGYVAFATSGTYYLNAAVAAYDEPPMEVGVIEGTTTGHMEVGTTTASTSWSTVTLTNTYTEPVVIASILDGNNPNTPVSTRVKNASGNSFQLRLDIPLDNTAPRTSNSETVYYMVVEAGTWVMGDGKTKVEADVVHDVSQVNCFSCGTWNKGVQVAHTSGYTANPAFFHQVMSENSANWISSFASNSTDYRNPPGTNGFRISFNGAEVTTAHAPEDIGYVVMETEKVDTANGIKYETDTTATFNPRGHDDARYSESFDQTYSAAPLVLVAQLSMRGTEGSWAMIDAISSTTLTMYEDEDQTRDAERSHQQEYYAYAAFASAGSFTLTDQTFLQNPVTVTLHNTYTNPVVVTTPYFTNDMNSPSSVRVYDVTSNSFTAKLDFPTDNFTPNNTSYSNDVYYMVVEAGTWQIGDLKLEAHTDTLSTVGSFANGWTGTTTTFSHTFTAPPIVLHQVMSNSDSQWISSWVAKVGDPTNVPTYRQMQIGLNAAEVTTSNAHGAETVGWIAFSNVGSGTVDGINFRTYENDELPRGHSDGCYTFTPGGTYTTPIPLLSQMSMDGSEGSWASVCSLSSTTVGTHLEEDDYRDSERSHMDEAVGAIVFDGTMHYAGSTNPLNHTSGTYTSPVLGDGAAWRNFNVIDWAETVDCTNCDVQIQVRTADTPADMTSATFIGPDGTADTYYDASFGDLLSLNHLSQPYVQYRATLSGSIVQSPLLYDTTIWGYAL